MSHKSIQLTAAIVNRGAGNRAASIFHTYNHEILLAVRGHGTASSAVMDCLGLDEPEKDLVLGLSNKSDADRLLHALGREMEFYKPGHGIAFTLSLSGISLAAMDILSRHEDQTAPNSHTAEHKEDISMTNSHSYELIASVIHTDLSAPVMEAARKAGCQGGTLIKAREIGTDAGKKLFGMTLSQEKAILLILTPADLRIPILKAICETVMKETGEHAVAISLPVDAVEGLAG
ncbi:hypothetical protein ADH76_29500 [Enterocloster clostridioformis]|uniref:hypothetical protein n=1 Tax=Enterocloster clostridioformis TaxID=1531 RepID=UPI00080C683E|nr:hypothetical protein [Enterocloster clostridioformis]ANU45236.1 hypothetical protein A4V08_04740 [Lachnoclostridium sp. YL32]NDO32459.1 hypothetical protein [Enterocloster clostridioformis]OXE63481.1 hypothetical protein ADH76_29500 [Enterocloster clostridioformis]QQR00001.1 hypothetical protein I5Q83_29890 [Enterocloster clostridioformis]